MIDKLYDINKQLDSLKGISYYCELREGVINQDCTECAKEHQQLAEWPLELKDFRAEDKKENVYT